MSYVSPLQARINRNDKLTLDVLRKHVPVIHDSQKAREQLQAAEEENQAPTRDEVQAYTTRILAGDNAKELLIVIALPLINSLAHKELSRRHSWASRIDVEDIISEGISGFIKGLYAYNPEGKHTSPTNYLGQWITTSMRRHIEHLDHDFSVPQEAIERHRKIRAIRSRLANDFSREPEDHEILDAANNQAAPANMLGPVVKKANPRTAARRKMTQKHLDEERDYRARTGSLQSTSSQYDGENYDALEAHNAQSVTDTPGEVTARTSTTIYDTVTSMNHLSSLIAQTLHTMGVNTIQRDIIKRKYALPPYDTEQTIRDITTHTGVAKHKVNRIVTAYATEMTTPNGAFHELIDQLTIDEIDALNLSWLITRLGEFTPPVHPTSNKDLTAPLPEPKTREEVIRDSMPNDGFHTAKAGVHVSTYVCIRDGIFNRNYPSSDASPEEVNCPLCGQPATHY